MIKSLSLAIAILISGTNPAMARGEKALAKCMWENNPAATEAFRLVNPKTRQSASLTYYVLAISGCEEFALIFNRGRTSSRKKLVRRVRELRPSEIGEDAANLEIVECMEEREDCIYFVPKKDTKSVAVTGS